MDVIMPLLFGLLLALVGSAVLFAIHAWDDAEGKALLLRLDLARCERKADSLNAHVRDLQAELAAEKARALAAESAARESDRVAGLRREATETACRAKALADRERDEAEGQRNLLAAELGKVRAERDAANAELAEERLRREADGHRHRDRVEALGRKLAKVRESALQVVTAAGPDDRGGY